MTARILIVDDSPTARAFAAQALAAAGYEVETAADIWVAPIVTTFRPDLILMDMHVGQQKGHIAVKAMKKRAFAQGGCNVMSVISLEC